jgi:hypothetical protein
MFEGTMLVLSIDEKFYGGVDSNGTTRVQPSYTSTALQLMFPKANSLLLCLTVAGFQV